METRVLPPWADELRRRYLRGEASMFVLHGNVFDSVLHDGKALALVDFLTGAMLKDSKETIAVYNLSTGLRFAKRGAAAASVPDELLLGAPGKDVVLLGLERLLTTSRQTAAVLDYAEALAPAGETSFQADSDRGALITLHRWSFLPSIEQGDNVVLLVVENLADLAPKLVSNPKVAVVEVPLPDRAARREAVLYADARLSAADADRYAEITAGLKIVQIVSILAPPPAAEEERAERETFILSLLAGQPDAEERARKLAALTPGLAKDEIRNLLAPGAEGAAGGEEVVQRSRRETDRLIARRKREIIERECFGLVEFVTPAHGFDVVGGMDEVKRDLLVVAQNIRDGRTSRVPMGILFTGPMGTGKTFVAEAFARECGLTTIKLKNFRSKWVGATEGNLEKILSVIKAIGQVVVIVDEGDRAFGNTDADGDSGTSSRVIARIKEFMSDTSNRGRILFLVMTNRPDRLDVDLKRAGRLDRKIPFLYLQSAAEVENIARAVIRKNKVACALDLATIRADFGERLVGYSNADIEAVVLMAHDDAAREAGGAPGGEPGVTPGVTPGGAPGVTPGVTPGGEPGGEPAVGAPHLLRAAADYFPSRDVELLQYMELLAVFEASSRRLLPAKYAGITPEELDARLRILRATVGSRR